MKESPASGKPSCILDKIARNYRIVVRVAGGKPCAEVLEGVSETEHIEQFFIGWMSVVVPRPTPLFLLCQMRVWNGGTGLALVLLRWRFSATSTSVAFL